MTAITWPTVEKALDVAWDHSPPELAAWSEALTRAVKATHEGFTNSVVSREGWVALGEAAVTAGLKAAGAVPQSIIGAISAALVGVISFLWHSVQGQFEVSTDTSVVELESGEEI